jgi:putative glycosyltransferase (TIGR04372 family)
MLKSLKQQGRDFLRRHPRLWTKISKVRLVLRPRSLSSRLSFANALSQQGNNREAADVLRRTLQLHPECYDAHVSLGYFYTRAKEHSDAEQHYRQAVARFPQSVALLLALSKTLIETGKYDDALRFAQEAVTLQPDSVDAHDAVAEALFWSGRYRESVTCRIDNNRRKIALNPSDCDALVTLGKSLQFAGKNAEAGAVWDRAIAVNPLDLKTYYAVWHQLISTGEFKAADHYFRRHRAAQQQLAEQCGFVNDGTRYLTATWTSQVGHISYLDYYLKSRELGLSSARRIVILAQSSEISNSSYLDCWKPYVEVVTDPAEIARLAPQAGCFEDYLAMQSFDRRDVHVWMALVGGIVQKRWEAERRKPLIALSDDHIRRGRDWLSRQGVRHNAWFATAHIREPGFHRRDPYQSFRHLSIARHYGAIREIVQRGGWVIRMGNPTMTPLPPMDRVIDYAHHPDRCDWLDGFLISQCRFHLGTQSGFSFLPATFGVPSVMTNWATWGAVPHFGQDLFIPKQICSVVDQRPLSLEEIFSSDLAVNQIDFLLTRHGNVRLVENTEQEITQAVTEMLDRLDGKTSCTAEDAHLQDRARACAEKHKFIIHSRLGCSYLREHRYLLGD